MAAPVQLKGLSSRGLLRQIGAILLPFDPWYKYNSRLTLFSPGAGKLVDLHNPAWVAVFANSLFAAITVAVIIWQVLVMKWQGRNSERHERVQNRLIRLQHEHDWLLRLNAEREQILKLGRQLHLAATSLKEKPSDSDQANWDEVRDTVYELYERLSILDLAVYTGTHDDWYPGMKQYVDAVLSAVLADQEFDSTYAMTDQTPNLSTRRALRDANAELKPIDIFLGIESAIRMEFFEFKEKWDAELY